MNRRINGHEDDPRGDKLIQFLYLLYYYEIGSKSLCLLLPHTSLHHVLLRLDPFEDVNKFRLDLVPYARG